MGTFIVLCLAKWTLACRHEATTSPPQHLRGVAAPLQTPISTPAHAPEYLVRRRPPQGADLFAAWAEMPPRLAVGQQHVGSIAVQPLEPWHVNRDVAARIFWQVDSRIVIHESSSVGRAEPMHFNDPSSPLVLRFPIALTVQESGEMLLRGELEAGFCREATCIPVRAPIRITLPAQTSFLSSFTIASPS